MYHGTGWCFEPDSGLWFTPDPCMASWYAMGRCGDHEDGGAPNVMPVLLRMVDPLEVDAAGAGYDEISFEGGIWATDHLAEEARERGNDGLIVRNVRDGDNRLGDVYFALSPEQFASIYGSGPLQAQTQSLQVRERRAERMST